MRLIDLAAVCRSTGLVVHEVDGWQQRSRRSNTQEYPPGGPTAVMCHHTASPPHTDGQRDVDYICYGSPVKPVSNLYLSRKAEVWVCAAGPTNTNGAGQDTWGGGVPVDSMNLYAIGIEAANNGVGEPWPWAQQAAYVKLCAALCRAYKIPVNSVRGHAEWSPRRKIDPAGQSQYATGSATWDMGLFRSDVSGALYPPPITPPPSEEIDMILIKHDRGGGAWTGLTYTGAHLAHVTTSDAWSIPVSAGAPVVDVNDVQLDALIRSAQTTNACPPEWVGTSRGAAWSAQRG